MIVTQVILIALLQSVVPFSTFALSILPHESEEEDCACNGAHPNQCKRCAVPSRKRRLLASEEDVAGHDASGIAKASHHCGGETSFVVAAHCVVDPYDGCGLAHISSGDDEEDGSVLRAHRYVRLVQQHAVADCADTDASDTEGVAVT